MNQQRFAQVDGILQVALELEEAARAAFLDKACAGDAALRGEVESLLGQPALEIPAFGQMAEELAGLPALVFAGQWVSHYQIKERLGAGGMGEVWKAWDKDLQRVVALKVLPVGFVTDAARVRRFEQEALAASRLNHPNIITIYEVLRAEGTHFIATEYVAGQTLRELLLNARTYETKRLAVAEVIEIVSQVAAALKAAHAAGIVHRDIKPENLMVRTDGLVKVLDFGIAKLGRGDGATGRRGAEEAEAHNYEVSFLPPSLTAAGAVLGTASYMSPEQARGQAIDHRTDLFSLGVVLYEMLTGRLPFAGKSRTEILTAQEETAPPPLASLAPKTPKLLQRIVSRALQCECALRYQTAEELLADLKELKQTLERQVRPAQLAWRASLVALIVLLAGVTGWSFFSLRSRPPAYLPAPSVTRLIATGNVLGAAISPDGRWVAYTTWPSEQSSLWLRQITTGDDTQLLPPNAAQSYHSLTFTPDNNQIYYLAYDARRDTQALYSLPTHGGKPSLVLEAINSPAAFSPDGRQFAFVRYESLRQQSALMVAGADGRGERTLVVHADPVKFSDRRIAWAPDGQSIAYALGTAAGPERNHRLYEYSLRDGRERLLSKHAWRAVLGVVWLGQRNALALIDEMEDDEDRIWQLDLATDERRLLSNELRSNAGLSVTADGRALATIQIEELQSLWVLPGADARRARRLVSGKEAGRGGLAWTPDGRILYASNASGKKSLWTIKPDGNEHWRFSLGDDNTPAASPDGRYLVFCSTTDGSQIWRMNRDGSNRKQLSFGKLDAEPRCSPDGRWVIYVAWDQSRRATLWRVPIEGGPAEQLTGETTANPSPVISPDGKWVAYYQRNLHETERKRILLIPSAGGAPVKRLDVPYTAYLLHWAPGGQALDYAEMRDGVANLWRLPLAGGPARQLTHFKSDAISRFAWSRDGGQLAVSRLIWNRDVILLRDFQ